MEYYTDVNDGGLKLFEIWLPDCFIEEENVILDHSFKLFLKKKNPHCPISASQVS